MFRPAAFEGRSKKLPPSRARNTRSLGPNSANIGNNMRNIPGRVYPPPPPNPNMNRGRSRLPPGLVRQKGNRYLVKPIEVPIVNVSKPGGPLPSAPPAPPINNLTLNGPIEEYIPLYNGAESAISMEDFKEGDDVYYMNSYAPGHSRKNMEDIMTRGLINPGTRLPISKITRKQFIKNGGKRKSRTNKRKSRKRT